MKCVNCAHEQDNGNFCRKCGTPLQAVDKPQVEKEIVSQFETSAATMSESVVQPSPTARPNGGGGLVKGFLNFDKMITPSIIKFVFWIGSGLTIISGLYLMIAGAASDYDEDKILVLMGILTILIGPFIIRIYCELLILFFKIHETLQEIKKGNSINN